MSAPPVFQPHNADEIAPFLTEHSEAGAPVRLRGGGSKAEFGRPIGNETMLDLSNLSGITLYEPGELVLTARAGTKLAEIEAAIAEHNQCMAFEPPAFGALFGNDTAAPTLGGAVASGWSGPRRIKAGAVRDHVLGALAVGGDGKVFKSGGRVVKNVTGYDLPKLLTGSHGTLAALTDITIKVLPAPEAVETLAILGLHDAAAIRLLSELLGGPYEISGAAHLPAAAAGRSAIAGIARSGRSATLIRLEGFGPSVADRFSGLVARCGRNHPTIALDKDECNALWREIRDVASLAAPDGIVWRLSLPPTDAPGTVAAIGGSTGADAFYDWGGGLVWFSLPAGDAQAGQVRRVLPSGHATLMRAPADIRAAAPVFQPSDPALAALQARVKAAFDPQGILAPGFMEGG